MAHLRAEDHLVVPACCPDLGDAALLEPIGGVVPLRRPVGRVREPQPAERGHGAVRVRDETIDVGPHVPAGARPEELQPVEPHVGPAHGVAIHVADHVGREQARGFRHRRVAADHCEQPRDERFARFLRRPH
jgi:hypothetical protein